jgi:hypothetical protein
MFAVMPDGTAVNLISVEKIYKIECNGNYGLYFQGIHGGCYFFESKIARNDFRQNIFDRLEEEGLII